MWVSSPRINLPSPPLRRYLTPSHGTTPRSGLSYTQASHHSVDSCPSFPFGALGNSSEFRKAELQWEEMTEIPDHIVFPYIPVSQGSETSWSQGFH